MIRGLFYPVLFAILLITGCSSDDNATVIVYECDFPEYRYVKGEREYVSELSKDFLLVSVDTTYSENQTLSFLSSLEYLDQDNPYFFPPQYDDWNYITLRFGVSKSCEEITQIIAELEQSQGISSAHYTMEPIGSCNMLASDSEEEECVLSYLNTFHVIVFDEEDLSDLHQIVEETNTEIINQVHWNLTIFELRATKTSLGDAWQMANYFYETGFFHASEPDLHQFYVE